MAIRRGRRERKRGEKCNDEWFHDERGGSGRFQPSRQKREMK
jgi:hypothetical protein